MPLIWGIHFIRNHKIKDIISEKILYIWSSLFICNLAALILKIILGRARPIMYILEQNYGFYWLQLDSNFWSMPSGHSTTIFALFLSFWCLYSYYSRIFIVLAVLVAASRIFLMKHYLSDVLFAILIDVVLLYCINRMIYKKKYLPKLIKYIESKPIFLARFLFLK